MKLSLDLRTSLMQTLTPQQIQYLKLLQLPLVQLEQQVYQEIEQNPLLEESGTEHSEDFELFSEPPPVVHEAEEEDKTDYSEIKDGIEAREFLQEKEGDPFEFYKMIWQDDADYLPNLKKSNEEHDDFEPFQIKDNNTFVDELLQQLRMHKFDEEEYILGEQILGNLDADGYLRRKLIDIVTDTNSVISELNFSMQKKIKKQLQAEKEKAGYNPAREYALSSEIAEEFGSLSSPDYYADYVSFPDSFQGSNIEPLSPVSFAQAEKVLKVIQMLDPPGIGSRDLKECLLAQLKTIRKPNAAQKLAVEILEKTYDALTMKHFNTIQKQLEVEEGYLREAIEVIRKLNPKPGYGDFHEDTNTIIPDFIIERDPKSDELIITVNDSRLPQLQVSKAYEKVKKEAKYKHFNKETREWIRNKYEDAKFLVQAIRQRKNTMLKVMTAIAHLQKDFFYVGSSGLKPLIYKIVAEDTGLDISTVCRIVNNKYVQTDYGTFELKYFFSESLANEEGEEISTTVIKEIIKGIIDNEPKSKPLSDDLISSELKKKGHNVARRTVAKYREQMRIPVARLRKEL